jgi:PAS domain S-box-containing protein
VTGLRAQLAESEDTLRAIGAGEVDTLMVAGKQGRQIFSLQGAEHSYRALIESMNEGALTITPDKTILYANECFARMVDCPLEQVIGGSLRRFLSRADRTKLRKLLFKLRPAGHKIHLVLHAAHGVCLPVQISIRPITWYGRSGAAIGMVVTDLSESQRSEERLQALSHRLVQAQEAERGRVARELHDHITQLLCAILVRCQTLADKLPPRAGPAKAEARQLRQLLGQTADEVERISRDLRPSVLEELGLVAVLRDTSHQFTVRTGVPVQLACADLPVRLAADVELALYRILQEALKNIEQHARARSVRVRLTRPRGGVQLEIADDGIGFNPDHPAARNKENRRLGLLGMRERAAYVGGVLLLKSRRLAGTRIVIRIPLLSKPPFLKTPQL